MTDTIDNFPRTSEMTAVDPPLEQSDTPLMGNPVLMRRSAPRKAGGVNPAWYAGAAIAAVVVAGGAFLFAAQAHHNSELMTNPPATPPAEQAAATPAPLPAPSTAPVLPPE